MEEVALVLQGHGSWASLHPPPPHYEEIKCHSLPRLGVAKGVQTLQSDSCYITGYGVLSITMLPQLLSLHVKTFLGKKPEYKTVKSLFKENIF